MGDSPPPADDNDNDNDNDKDKDVPDTNVLASEAPIKTENPLQADNWADYIPTTDHVRFFRETDWEKTPMGRLQEWETALRLQVFMVLADSRPACLYWFVLSGFYPTLLSRNLELTLPLYLHHKNPNVS